MPWPTGAPLVLLFHLTDFAEPLPGVTGKRKLFTLSHLSGERKRARCRSMLERVRGHYRVETTEALLARHDDRAAAAGGPATR